MELAPSVVPHSSQRFYFCLQLRDAFLKVARQHRLICCHQRLCIHGLVCELLVFLDQELPLSLERLYLVQLRGLPWEENLFEELAF